MENYLINQLVIVRENTINLVKGMEENTSELVPEKLNNNIKWNLGHIYVVGEKFLFQIAEEEANIPSNYSALFNPGTSPSDWKQDPPSLDELTGLLEEQINRLNSVLPGQLDDKVKNPYTTSTGFTLTTVKEFISFCLYHEGMHFGAIKNIKKLIN
ncbi:DinB family protein [Gracilibacillus oryzae]|uniref:DinB family protein n=1 Tax=Gracilibacillus oryzae TaxID=1672701 RepID=A0A7C8GQT3_9BACI|nr:DinB family protein [Gracilibacillus oryzae]KAB8126635.1 DinB family protein [Gracilibacillus oryzae]